jgi:hypothetical protein
MIRNVFIIILFIFSASNAKAHIDLIPLSAVSYSFNQKLDKTFSYQIIFNNNGKVLIEDIGIAHYNVGDDDTSSLQLTIYDLTNNQIYFQTDTNYSEIYFQTVFINLGIEFESNREYLFEFKSKNSNNDDLIHLIQGPNFPISNEFFPMTTQNIYSDYPSKKIALTFPMLTIGIGNQIGIDFTQGKYIKKYPSDTLANVYSTKFKTLNKPFEIKKIGLNYLDVGIDNTAHLEFSIYDSTHTLIYSVDSVINNLHKKKFDLNFPIILNKKTTYYISVRNLNIKDQNNIMLAYSFDTIPYTDKLNYIEILSFEKDNQPDSLGISYYFIYNDKISSVEIEAYTKEFISKIEKELQRTILTFNNKIEIDKINIFDNIGKKIPFTFLNENQIQVNNIDNQQLLFINYQNSTYKIFL